MPRLSIEEKQQVESFAKRHAAFILAMTEADDKLTGISQKDLSKLHKNIILGARNQIERPELGDLEKFIESLEVRIEECRKRNTPADLMEMMKAANAGAMLMNDHMAYNHPRLADAVDMRMTEIHHTAYTKRWEEMGMLLPDGHVKIGDQISLNPIGNFQPHNQDPNFFDPSDAIRDTTKWTKIAFGKFKNADGNHLFNSIFFIADPPTNGQPEDFTAFELVSLKHTADGIVYEVRWEGTSHTEEMTPGDLEERSARGLWASPKPQGA